MKEKITKYLTILNKLSFVIIPLMITISIQVFYIICNSDYKKAMYIPGYIIGLIIMILLFTLISVLAKSTFLGSILLSVFLFFFMIIDQLKIVYTVDPILFSDFLMLNDTKSLIEITNGTLGSNLLKLIPLMLLLLFMLSIACVAAYFLNYKFENLKIRIISGVCAFALIVIMFVPINAITVFMKDSFFDKVTADDDNHTTTNIAYYNKNGVVAGMYGLLLCNRFIEPDSYADISDNLEDMMEKEGGELNDPTSGKWGQPNIIMVFSESFWDIDKLDEITFDKPITSNFNALKEKGIYAEMISPSFGGISANVEYEMLTGSNIGFFNEGYIPYMQLMNNDNYYNAPYVTTELKNNGYHTKIVSTWSDALFNCARAYDYMGVDEVEYNKDFENPDKKGGRISEKQVVDTIIDNLKNKKADEKLFYMTLTAQTHMPYYLSRYDNYDVKITDSTLPTELQEMVQCYAQGVYDADKELERLYEYIQDFDEPTIIIFYGDHLPYLKTNDGDNAYDMLDYFNTDDTLLNTYRKYNTQCLITGNFDLGTDDIDYIGPDLVMPYVMNKCDFKLNNYYRYLNSTIHKLPAFNCFVAIDDKGNLYNPTDFNDDLEACYDMRECVNWKYYVDLD